MGIDLLVMGRYIMYVLTFLFMSGGLSDLGIVFIYSLTFKYVSNEACLTFSSLNNT